ncbi:MAG: RDD family protein [Acidimicrobiia bacterium]
MRLDDRITISTPEGLDMEITLAGVGSRAIAGLLDLTIEVLVLIALLLAFRAIGSGGNGFVVATFVVVAFLVLFGYFVLFEVLNHGRSPGKMAVGLRVVRTDGGPVTFIPSAVRNLLRLIDGWDLLTLILCPIGTIAVVATRDNQRLGDLAAGTVVARERFAAPGAVPGLAPAFEPGALGWDVSAITPDELVTVRRFLDRRYSLAFHARMHLADELAARLRPKVVAADPSWPSEPFLEALVAAKSGRS